VRSGKASPRSRCSRLNPINLESDNRKSNSIVRIRGKCSVFEHETLHGKYSSTSRNTIPVIEFGVGTHISFELVASRSEDWVGRSRSSIVLRPSDDSVGESSIVDCFHVDSRSLRRLRS